jgi:hypothetical protein
MNMLTSSIAGDNSAAVTEAQREALIRGNCRVGSGSLTGTYNLFIYITND